MRGRWRVAGGFLEVSSAFGCAKQSAGALALNGVLPKEAAERLLWDIARKADPKRPFFYWK